MSILIGAITSFRIKKKRTSLDLFFFLSRVARAQHQPLLQDVKVPQLFEQEDIHTNTHIFERDAMCILHVLVFHKNSSQLYLLWKRQSKQTNIHA